MEDKGDKIKDAALSAGLVLLGVVYGVALLVSFGYLIAWALTG